MAPSPPLPTQLQPSTLLVLSFALTILVGTGLLLLPGITTGEPLTLLQALFTATSATCVTGLIVVDTATDLSAFGQAVVLLLIQVGGLGILTFSTVALSLLGQRGTVRTRQLFQDMLQVAPHKTLGALVWRVVLYTLVTEMVGALVLYGLFARQAPPGASVAWLAVFHSVSGLCNAGFSLFSDSMESLRDAHGITFTLNALIVLGGLGFIVLMELPRWATAAKPRPHLSLHTRVVLVSSAVLLVGGTVGLYFLERGVTLAGLSTGSAWSAALFHSVNARTAGFNSLPIGQMTGAGLFMLIALMFIGGSPGSIAGGVKTTTVTIFGALCYGWLRGRSHVTIGKRHVPDAVVQRAIAAIGISVLTIGVGMLLLLWFEDHGGPLPTAHEDSLQLWFEAVSAFGTVGLSTGITSSLAPGSQLVLIGLMFAGRVGPLSLTFTLLGEPNGTAIGYPEESVMIG